MPELVIIRGLPGAGKSTYAKTHYPDHVLMEADQYFMKNGVYNYNPNLIHNAHEHCFYETISSLSAGKDVVVANTFVINSHISRYTRLIAEMKPSVDIRIVELEPRFTSIHNVPKDTIEKMARRWQSLDEFNSKYKIEEIMNDLIMRKESVRYPGLFVKKYRKKVFFDNLWNTSEELLEARGHVELADGTIVINPFTKIFNHTENGVDIDPDEDCLVVEKINGFMACATYVRNGINKVVVSTTGSLDSEYVDIAEKYITDKVKDIIKSDISGTLMFEICDPSDPHIIPQEAGAYLIGIRNVNSKGKYCSSPATEGVLDHLAIKLGVKRPLWWPQRFGDVVSNIRGEGTEGFVVYGQKSGIALKIKSPYYLALKAAARVRDIMKLDKSRVDEEFYDLIDYLKSNKILFQDMAEQERLDFIRGYYAQSLVF